MNTREQHIAQIDRINSGGLLLKDQPVDGSAGFARVKNILSAEARRGNTEHRRGVKAQ
jgi:hypothetical protein